MMEESPEEKKSFLRTLVETLENGRWPTPIDIDNLRSEQEYSLTFFARYPELRMPTTGDTATNAAYMQTRRSHPGRTLIADYVERGLLLARALHVLALRTDLSLQETAQLTGGDPTAWGRLRAKAALAQEFRATDRDSKPAGPNAKDNSESERMEGRYVQVEKACRRYIQDHQSLLDELIPAVVGSGDKAAFKALRERFGPTAIARAIAPDGDVREQQCIKRALQQPGSHYAEYLKPLFQCPPKAPKWWMDQETRKAQSERDSFRGRRA